MKWRKIMKEYLFLVFILGLCCINFFLFCINLIPKTILYGTYESAVKPALEISGVMSGTYQSKYQDWFAENFPFRSFFVKGYAQWMALFKAPVNGVGFGKDGQLFEEYFTKQTISGDLDDKTLLEYAGNLAIISDHLSQENKAFIYLISPSKAEVYSDKLIWNMQLAYNMNLQENALVRKKLIKALQSNEISYLDYTLLMEELKEDGEYQPFNSTGIHWNQYGAANAVIQLNEFINAELAIPTVNLAAHYSTDHFMLFDEKDMKDLTNTYFLPSDKEYISAMLEINGELSDKSVFAMSTSFLHSIANLFAQSNMPFKYFWRTQYTQFQDRLYYDADGKVKWEAWLPGQDTSGLNYSEILSLSDIILVESNAAEIPESHIGFVREFAAFLGRMDSLSEYIENVCGNENNLVIITSNNISELYLNSEQTELLKKLGIDIAGGNKNLSAVLDGGKLLVYSFDNMGNECEGTIDGRDYMITFSEEDGRSKSTILFDENCYWSDIHGLNFLVYDKSAEQLTDWVIFDVNNNCAVYR